MDSRRRDFLGAAGAAASGAFLSKGAVAQTLAVNATDHWATKRADGEAIRLFVRRKRTLNAPKGALLFVHGAWSQSAPEFDLQVPGKPQYSVMDSFARLGYDTWTFDCEGYGRSDKSRATVPDLSAGADDIGAVADYIAGRTGSSKLSMYGASAGALRIALYAQRHPLRIGRIALEAFAWTGEGSEVVAERRKRLSEIKGSGRRAIDRQELRALMGLDGVGDSAEPEVADAFVDAVLALDESLPTGPEADLAEKLPLVDPAAMRVPALLLRCQRDTTAAFRDVAEFFGRLDHPDKQLAVLPGRGSSLRSRNWQAAHHLLGSFFSQPAPAYSG